MSVETIYSRDVDTVRPEESVQVAARRMHSRKVGTLVVVNAANEPIGMLTDRDLALRVVAMDGDPPRTTVRDVMTPHPRTVTLDAGIREALRIMRDQTCRRIPVVDAAGKLAGVLSIDDVLELLAEEIQLIAGLIREESPRSLAGAF